MREATSQYFPHSLHRYTDPRKAKAVKDFRLGAKIYSCLFFANATGACLGIFANSELLPLMGYEGVFIFYGTLTILSGLLLLMFTIETKPQHPQKAGKVVE